MKLAARDANAFFAKPDTSKTGILLFGEDAMRVALKRQQLVAALVGPNGEEEMRLTRIPAADLRKEPALLSDATTTQSFFPGPRVALVEDAADGLAPIISGTLQKWQTGDAHVVVTAKSLNARSALRKAFEGDPNAVSVGIYNDPPSRDEIEGVLKDAGLSNLAPEAMNDVQVLARAVDPGDFRQTIAKLALYKYGDASPVTSVEVQLCAPATTDAAMDDVLNCVADSLTDEIGPIMQKLRGQGVQPVGLCIAATRHFRTLHLAAADPGGAAAGIARVRPPVFGPRRDRMVRQASRWGVRKLEVALQMLTDTDLCLRSAAKVPQMATMERTLIRLAMLGR